MGTFGVWLDVVGRGSLSNDPHFVGIKGGKQQINYVMKRTITRYIPQLVDILKSIDAKKLYISPSIQLQFDVSNDGDMSVNLTDLQKVSNEIPKIIYPHIDTFWLAVDSILEEVHEMEVDCTGRLVIHGAYPAPDPFDNHFVNISLSPDSFYIVDLTEKQRLEIQGKSNDIPELYKPLVDKCRAFMELPNWSEWTWITTAKSFTVSFTTKGEAE